MVFLTGPHGAGKTAISDLFKQNNFWCFELGQTLRDQCLLETGGSDFAKWCQDREDAYGKSFTDKLLTEKIMELVQKARITERQPQDIVLVGSRSYNGIQFIDSHIPQWNERKRSIIFIDAAPEVLRTRFSFREGREYTPIEFQGVLDRDRDIGLESIRSHADFIVSNDGTKEELCRRAEGIIFEKLEYNRIS